MTEQLKLKLNDSKATRWGALVIVAFTMMAAYYVNDVVAPLKTMLETDLAWSSTDFGFFTCGYSFLNVFFLMLIWGGLILDRFGIRFTGKLATILMVGGTAFEYYAMTGPTRLYSESMKYWAIKRVCLLLLPVIPFLE